MLHVVAVNARGEVTKAVAYDIRVRADWPMVTLILPNDLTAMEATRLCNFIMNIPLSIQIAIQDQERLLTIIKDSRKLLDTKLVK